jgi:peptidoglycan/LPS O-acetylase OafA/YrhL
MRSQGQSDVRRVRLTEFLAGDPIRGVGVLAVISFHVAFYSLFFTEVLERHPSGAGHRTVFDPLGGRAIGTLIETGGYALALFFALSGYLISRPFVFAVVRGEALPRLSSFARNRVLRIVPAFWVVFTLLLLIYGTKGASTGQIFSTYTFVEGWTDNPLSLIIGQAWSLRAEALFYVLVPITGWLLLWVTIRLGSGTRLRTALVVGLPLAVAGTVIWMNSWWDTERTNPVTVLYMFMAGVAFAGLETFLPARVERFGRRHRGSAWAASTAVAITGFMLLYSVQYFDPQSVELGGTLIFFGLAGVFGGALLLQWGTGGCWRLLDNRILRWLGQRSYSIYLVHLVIVVELAPRFLRAFDDNYERAFLALTAVSVASSVLLGELLFRLVEAPFMNLKTKGFRSPERTAAWRRAAWWLPSKALGRLSVTATVVAPASAKETVAESPVAAEPSTPPATPSRS